ncbi:MAG: hyuC [Verrucomicrobiales bacterium]|nr:hyuC [Verrucomicrobiales bacterium]
MKAETHSAPEMSGSSQSGAPGDERKTSDLTDLADTLVSRLDELGKVSDEEPRLVRTFLSPASARANALVGGWMRGAGLNVREDAWGNLWGSRPGPPGSRTLLIGSHLDTVVDAGRFDGPAGVLLGIAVARAVAEADLPFGLEVVGFSDEEGVRFQSTYLGSRGCLGLLTPAELALTDDDGIRLGDLIEVRRRAGFSDAVLEAGNLLGYLEMHIEQGPVLEAENLPLAVVPGIAGQTRILAGFTGKAGHAGTTPMALRHDALTAAARMVTEAETLARDTPGLLATVGKLEVAPGAGNVIPGACSFTLDVRSPDNNIRLRAVEDLENLGSALARERGLAWHWEIKQSNPAVPCDAALTTRLAEAAAADQPRVPCLFSGAGHDAAVFAGSCPAAMLFIRCRGGLSHHPDEFASPEDLAAALRAAVRFVLNLAEKPL